jgi:hypothetical protein
MEGAEAVEGMGGEAPEEGISPEAVQQKKLLNIKLIL